MSTYTDAADALDAAAKALRALGLDEQSAPAEDPKIGDRVIYTEHFYSPHGPRELIGAVGTLAEVVQEGTRTMYLVDFGSPGPDGIPGPRCAGRIEPAPSVSEVEITPSATTNADLALAQAITDADFTARDRDGDTLTVERGIESGIAATIKTVNGEASCWVYIEDDSLDYLITYLQALQTIRDSE